MKEKTDNELIAEFMGLKPERWRLTPLHKYRTYWCMPDGTGWTSDGFRFKYDWNELMIVINKIIKMNYSVHIYPTRARFYKNHTEFIESIHPDYPMIDVVYCGVIDFIKWFNSSRIN